MTRVAWRYRAHYNMDDHRKRRRVRYAIYLTPRNGSALEAAATAWLGRSAFPHGREARSARAPASAAAPVPARYGFHATLRAPFRLAVGASEDDLIARFHATYRGTPLNVPLKVSALRHFVALTAEDGAIPALAAAEKRALECFEDIRAPLTEAERARRKPDQLDATSRALLDAWGYPHVLERFTFHMTLSGPICGSTAPVVAAARTHFASLLRQPAALYHAIYREETPGGPFTVLVIEGADRGSDRAGALSPKAERRESL